MFSYCPTRREQVVTWPKGVQFVIGVSGQVAEKTGDKMADYNDASLLAKEAARVYCSATGTDHPHLAAVCASASNNADAMRAAIRKHFASGGKAAFTEQQLLVRFDQFFAESEELVAGVANALQSSDWPAFAAAVERSQELTTTHLQNQVDETVFLASKAKECGAIAASAFGAGFGGSVWALVKDEDVAGFVGKWKAAYSVAFPAPSKTSEFFPMVPGPGAFEVQAGGGASL